MKRALFIFVILVSSFARAQEDPEFAQKLQEMLKRTDKSIEILREQISENQSAPFLADLYLQLGELISQRANALYYVQMERHKVTSQTATATKEFNPVVETQREAIQIFRKILDEFPNYEKRKKILFLLAVTYKSIDEQVGFEDTTEKLIKEFGSSKEGMQARLLLGQQHFDKNDFDKAWSVFAPAAKSNFPYERNLAKYRMGLVNLTREKHRDALDMFRSVVVDEELKEEDNPFAVSLETKTVKSSLKREALIDSIRAYTYVFKENPDPVAYYAAICPTEVLFQEVIEKLAYRYIALKKYEHAVGLLRTLSERIADPQKVMNIYHEVLLAIPLAERIDIPVQEIRFVLEKYNLWTNYYDLPSKVKQEASVFFEKQIRDLGTKSHDRAKLKSAVNKNKYLVNARDFYLLYLGFFPQGKNSVKMATNLADVYFRMSNYLKSGEYYLRTFSGEFGAPSQAIKKDMIQNAILILQKNQKHSYFDQLRVRGLLHRAIKDYMDFDKKQLNNPDLTFTYIKNQYDQGFYDLALDGFVDYIKKFPNHKNATNASEIILDYFNTKNDVDALNAWANKLLALPKINPVMKKRIEAIRSQTQLKKLQETVKATTGGDEFAQGKGYLEAALTVSDEGMKSVALKQALSRSRAEQDFETFFRAARLMADKEPNQLQKYRILTSVPQELLGVGRYYAAIEQYADITKRKDLNPTQKAEAFNKALNLSLLLRDFTLIERFINQQGFAQSEANKKRLYQQIADALESSADVPDFLLDHALSKGDDALLLAAFKGQFKFSNQRSRINAAARAQCQQQASSALCGWLRLPELDKERSSFVAQINGAGTALESIEPTAQLFVKVISSHQAFSQFRDPVLQIAVTLRNKQLFETFAVYLNRVSKANPEVKSILVKKVQEAARNAKLAHKRCRTIMDSAGLYSPVNRFCTDGKVPSISDALNWPKLISSKNLGKDPQDGDILNRQKVLFLAPTNVEEFIGLLRDYKKRGYYGMVSAGSVYGAGAFPAMKTEINAIHGCSLISLGLYSEAAYYLTAASSDPEAQQCRKKLDQVVE